MASLVEEQAGVVGEHPDDPRNRGRDDPGHRGQDGQQAGLAHEDRHPTNTRHFDGRRLQSEECRRQAPHERPRDPLEQQPHQKANGQQEEQRPGAKWRV
jgi:hypothetical protein